MIRPAGRRPPLARFMERLWSDAEAAYREKLLASLFADPAARLLDVGCDDGAWTDEVRRKLGIPAHRVHGIEVVPDRAELARARGFDVRTGDLDERWLFDDESVSIVHANQVIEHVARLDHFVGEVARVLVPGGAAVVCTENLASWHNVGALLLGYQPFSLANVSRLRPIGNPLALNPGAPACDESWQHVHVATLIALRDIFVAHGFALRDSWGAGYHPFPAPLAGPLARLDPRHAHFIGVVVRKERLLSPP